MESIIQQNLYEDEINFREVFEIFWSGRKLILAITALFTVITIVIVLAMPNQYIASSVLAPAENENDGLSSALSRLGGLASFAGLTVGSGESSEAQVAVEIMKSWAFVDDFITKNKLQAQIYAANGWNKDKNKLKYNANLYDDDKQKWLLENDKGQYRDPSSWELYTEFSEKLTINSDIISGLVTVKIEYYSPYLAKEWVDSYVIAINKHMQQRRLNKVNSNIDYLHVQIEKTSISYMHEVFYTIIEEQIKSKMLVEATPDHTFITVSPSMLPEEKSRPRRVIICILGTFLGLVLSVFLTYILHMFGFLKSRLMKQTES